MGKASIYNNLCGTTLDRLEFTDVLLKVGRVNRRRMFKDGANVNDVAAAQNLVVGGVHQLEEKVQTLLRLRRNGVHVRRWAEVARHGHTEISHARNVRDRREVDGVDVLWVGPADMAFALDQLVT